MAKEVESISMKTIKIRLVGGLGNQLFQFGYALILKKKYFFDKIQIDISDMSKYKENWGFLLYNVLDQNKLSGFLEIKKSFILKSRVVRIISSIEMVSDYLGFISSKNGKRLLNSNAILKKKNIFLDGYFEYYDEIEKYINALTQYLRADLRIYIPDNVLVINIRGGEFINIGKSSIEDKIIYKSLINKAIANISNPVIHVVSDDIEFAKELMENVCNVDVYHPADPFENFRVVFSAHHKIIARSTFSKWAGLLSKNFSNVYWIEQ